jgi:hypothetical protein
MPPGRGVMDALDPEPLLRFLHESGVEHILIGGVAVAAHGYRRPSRDLDIVPAPEPANLSRLAEALSALHAHPTEMGDFTAGDDLYAELAREALTFWLDDVPVRYCGLGHLRSMKSAAGRPRDADDLEHLPAE